MALPDRSHQSHAGGNSDPFCSALQEFLGETVVLDTAGTIVYIGTLRTITAGGLWLEHADVHDCSDGHANKELYVHEAKIEGVRTNRRRVFVMRPAIISVSRLADVVQEDLDGSAHGHAGG